MVLHRPLSWHDLQAHEKGLTRLLQNVPDDSARAVHGRHAHRMNLTAGCQASKHVDERESERSGSQKRILFEVSETIEPLLVSLSEPTKGLILVFQSGITSA